MKEFSKIWLKPVGMIVTIMVSLYVILSANITVAQDAQPAPVPLPQIIKNIQVQGNQRVEANTVASYLLFAPGDPSVSYTHLTLPTKA